MALEKNNLAKEQALINQAAMQDADDEASWMAVSPVLPLKGLTRKDAVASPAEAVRRMQEEGLVRINGCLEPDAVHILLEHVTNRLVEAKVALAATGDTSEAQKMFGTVRRPTERADLKCRLLPPVAIALADALSPLLAVIDATLGPDAQLFELGAFISDPAAPRQGLHPDTLYTPTAAACSVFIALQDIDDHMGPTHFLPGTHVDLAAHIALSTRGRVDSAVCDEAGRAVDASSDVGSRMHLVQTTPRHVGTMSAGDAVLFDSRLLHCGGANSSPRRRILFYFSFRAAGAVTPYSLGSLDIELQMRRLLLKDASEWIDVASRGGVWQRARFDEPIQGGSLGIDHAAIVAASNARDESCSQQSDTAAITTKLSEVQRDDEQQGEEDVLAWYDWSTHRSDENGLK